MNFHLLKSFSYFQNHCCVLYSIIGWNSQVGDWTRIEGTPNDPNPNKPFAKLEAIPTFTNDGKLNPSITVIGMYYSNDLLQTPQNIKVSVYTNLF